MPCSLMTFEIVLRVMVVLGTLNCIRGMTLAASSSQCILIGNKARRICVEENGVPKEEALPPLK
jgi:hypothetical protein